VQCFGTLLVLPDFRMAFPKKWKAAQPTDVTIRCVLSHLISEASTARDLHIPNRPNRITCDMKQDVVSLIIHTSVA
jgi:hypothetical protein